MRLPAGRLGVYEGHQARSKAMPLNFDPGYIREPFQSLCDQAPDASIYPYGAFRTE